MSQRSKLINTALLGICCLALFTNILQAAAKSEKNLDELLEKVKTCDYGQSWQALTELNDLIRDSHNSPAELKRIEAGLLKALQSNATPVGEQFICRKLSTIGTKQSIFTLAEMLTMPKSSEMARYALERIPSADVDEVLRKALPKTTGRTKVGIINSLGRRRDTKSTQVLGELIYDSDEMVAAASVAALGYIADSHATKTLARAKNKTKDKLRTQVLDAYLNCANQFAAKGEKEKALAIYKQLSASDEPALIRAAALRGMVILLTAARENVVDLIINAVRDDEVAIQAAAVTLIREIPGPEVTKALAKELPNLSVTSQVQLLLALADRGDRTALPAVTDATKAEDVAVRVTALKSLGKLGDASNVALLTQIAATAKTAEQQAARESLYRLHGPKVNQTIIANIQSANPQVKVELIRSIARRNVVAGVETLLKTARDEQVEVRIESFKALKVVAKPEDLPALVKLLTGVQSEAERKEVEMTVVVVARKKMPEGKSRSGAVLAVLPYAEEVSVRCSLLRVIGKIADNSALPPLRAALKNEDVKVKDVAVRAIANWPNAEPIDDLLQMASSPDSQIHHRVLALRGFVRLIELDSSSSAEDKIKMYEQAMGLASDPAEKKMVLSGLATVKSFAALQAAADYLDDAALRQEAEAAVVKIAEAVHKSYPQQTKAVLQKVLETSTNDLLRKQAQEVITQIE